MIGFRRFAVSSLLFAAACATDASPTSPPGDPGELTGKPAAPGDQRAIALGMTIMSTDAVGTPRLMRALVPRPSAAGLAPEAAARDHVAALEALWVDQGRPMTLVENGTQRLRNGATVVRLAQYADGVLVDQSELRVLLHSNGALAAVSGTLLPATTKPAFASSPREAAEHALAAQYPTARVRPALSDAGEHGGWNKLAVAAGPELRVTSARTRRTLTRVAGKPVAAWEIEVVGDAPPDPLRDPSIPAVSAMRYLVADATGKVLRKTDLIQNDAFVYRAFAETTGNRRPLDGALQSFAPHPTGIPDGSAPDFATSNLVVMEAFNGPRDPWLPNNATTTSGNNADAFSDLDGSGVFGDGDMRPAVRAGRVLNYAFDPTAEPLATPTQANAGTVNAFFLVNWMHDWFYDSGFTETTGNAQLDNYGRGGIPGDPLSIGAQSGAHVGSRNNAFMFTPSDGFSPEMAMFLWTAGTVTAVIGPAGPIRSESFAAGPRSFDLTAELVAGNDSVAPTNDGCQPLENVAGKIVLLTFSGACGSLATVNNARAAGAIGVVLADGDLEDPRSFAGSAAANIPGLAIGRSGGLALAAALVNGPVSVTLQSAVSGPERDGDLDNTVIAHEWGHYLHHRLADCGAQQCGGMSEGWGDFNALLMMLREGDNRDGVYALAPFAVADGTPDAAYFGLRRFPYSLDRTKNALSFRHIGDDAALPTDTPGFPGGANSEVHNTGEIWATMLWEVLNVLVDEHGVTVARRRMSDYIVAGLLLTPPNATFTEARDALLAAASALDTDDMLLMAAAFAGRGAGSCAVSPSNDAIGNVGVIESGTIAAKLQVSGVTLTDDGISCDHDGYLDPGESGLLRVTVANAGILAADAVRVTATTDGAGIRIGAPIVLPLLQPFATATLTIPVTFLQTAPRNAIVTFNLRVEGENTCEPEGIALSLTTVTGADDLLNVAKTDHVQTRATAWTKTGDGADAFWAFAIEPAGNKSWFARSAGFVTDTSLVSPPLVVSPTQPFTVKFLHAYDLETSSGILFDGAVVELSTDGGTTWADVSTFGVNPNYTGQIFVGASNPLSGRLAFSGRSVGYPARTSLFMNFGTQLAGQSVRLRFRVGTDEAVVATGWDIDDVEVTGITNTPFHELVPEPATCTARKGPLEDSTVLATTEAMATSLDPFDGAVCIAHDTP